ncbi:MAG TPA: hypothetical protein VG963_04900, partial [Polyangiaceae bacterium]|nr:hypothetical protein [Polyangiaceae bacterium]
MIKQLGLGAIAAALVVAGRSATADNHSAPPPGSDIDGRPGRPGPGHPGGHREHPSDPAVLYRTKTPIKHLVVIFGENISFDHYFATYPKADNQAAAADGGTFFRAAAHTPRVNNLLTPLDPARGFARRRGGPNLFTENPN